MRVYLLFLLHWPWIIGYCLSSVLRYYSQTLRISHHVSTNAKSFKIHLFDSCTAVRKLHLYLPRNFPIHQCTRIRACLELLQTPFHHHHNSRRCFYSLCGCLSSIRGHQLLPQTCARSENRRATSLLSNDALLGRSEGRSGRSFGCWV